MRTFRIPNPSSDHANTVHVSTFFLHLNFLTLVSDFGIRISDFADAVEGNRRPRIPSIVTT
ncbi:MAG: hypothetical protein DME86_07600 [Verrucomicrobia bacterium]|nr:MAG: hypothetical protein DME86_07600 [Verrucomicrobiota bacterium]